MGRRSWAIASFVFGLIIYFEAYINSILWLVWAGAVFAALIPILIMFPKKHNVINNQEMINTDERGSKKNE